MGRAVEIGRLLETAQTPHGQRPNGKYGEGGAARQDGVGSNEATVEIEAIMAIEAQSPVENRERRVEVPEHRASERGLVAEGVRCVLGRGPTGQGLSAEADAEAR
jgi:hypothetical protein